MKYIVSLIVFTLISCSSNVSENDLKLLNGYWEIDRVTSTETQEKQYTINTTVDFFEINESLHGYRKKLIPHFSGNYQGNNQKNVITIKEKGGQFYILNDTKISQWEEQIAKLDKQELVLINSDGITYYYKKHEKLDIE